MEKFAQIIATLVTEVEDLKLKQDCLVKAMKKINPELIEEANKIIEDEQDELKANYRKLYNLK